MEVVGWVGTTDLGVLQQVLLGLVRVRWGEAQ